MKTAAFEILHTAGKLDFDLYEAAHDFLVTTVQTAAALSDLHTQLAKLLAPSAPSLLLQIALGTMVFHDSKSMHDFTDHAGQLSKYQITVTPAYLVVLAAEPYVNTMHLLRYVKTAKPFGKNKKQADFFYKALLECAIIQAGQVTGRSLRCACS